MRCPGTWHAVRSHALFSRRRCQFVRIKSRSAALHRAIRLLRASELGDAYAAAFAEWADDSANDVWDNTVVDS